MPDSKQKTESVQVLDDYMLKLLEWSNDNSKRHEERSDKAVQLFMALFTALAGGGVAVLTNVQDVTLKSYILAFDLMIMTGFGVLTYFWVLSSSVARQIDWMERYFLYKYFHDKDKDNFDKYGQTVYSLEVYKPIFQDKPAQDNLTQSTLVTASSFSLVALVIFSSATAAGAGYTGWLALAGVGSVVPAIVVGALCIAILMVMWRLSLKSLQANKSKGQEILKYHRPAQHGA